MENLDVLFEIYHSINKKYENDKEFFSFRKGFISNVTKLYQTRITSYGDKRKEENGKDVLKILEWLVKNDSENQNWRDLLIGFIEQLKKAKAASEGEPIIDVFTTNEKYILSGSEIKLNWSVRNFSTLKLYDGNRLIPLDTEGYKQLTPFAFNKTEIKKYRLHVTNKKGIEREKYCELVVFPLPKLELIETPFPEFEKKTNLSINVNIPSFNIFQTIDTVLNKVSFYPEIFRTLYNYDSSNLNYKSTFNIYFIYGRIRDIIRSRRTKNL